jgi:hypothetical protein
MTQQEIRERNEQIALMLGYRLITPDMRRNPDKWNTSYWQKDYPEKQDVLCSEGYLPFHSDWGSLMKSVEFIEELNNYFVQIEEKSCYVYDISKFDDSQTNAFIIKDGETKREAVFIAVSDFAKLYNDKKL